MKVLPRDAKIGATVEHVKQLRDDITTTTSQNMKDSLTDALKPTEDRISCLEDKISQIMLLLEKAQGQREVEFEQAAAASASSASTSSGPRRRGSRSTPRVPGE